MIIKVGKAETPFFRQSMALFFLQPCYGDMYEGWNFNSGNYLFTTDTK